jgi:hypothetical protein
MDNCPAPLFTAGTHASYSPSQLEQIYLLNTRISSARDEVIVSNRDKLVWIEISMYDLEIDEQVFSDYKKRLESLGWIVDVHIRHFSGSGANSPSSSGFSEKFLELFHIVRNQPERHSTHVFKVR